MDFWGTVEFSRPIYSEVNDIHYTARRRERDREKLRVQGLFRFVRTASPHDAYSAWGILLRWTRTEKDRMNPRAGHIT